MKQHALLIDYKYCTGCHSCELACSQEKKLGEEEWGIKVTEYGPYRLGDSWYWNYVPVPSSLCDLCLDRIQDDLKPACAHHCLAQCMEVVSVEKLSEALMEKGDTTVCFVP